MLQKLRRKRAGQGEPRCERVIHILNVDKEIRAWVLDRKKTGMTESDVIRNLIRQAEAPGFSVEHLDAKR